MHQIFIEKLVLYGFHGVFQEERILGGRFEVDLWVTTDFGSAMQTDKLEGTIDYASLVELITKEMAIPSNLLESLGKRIIDSIKKQHTQIKKVKIKISKCHPPIKGEMNKVGIIVEE